MAIIDNSKTSFINDNDENIFIGIENKFIKGDIEGWFKSTKTTIEAVKQNIRSILKTEKDAEGRRLEVIEIEMSYKRLIPDDDEPSSYINFYIANGGIVMPSFDDEKADKKAQNIIKSVFPKRKILALNGIDISLGGGNIHCITQQQPLSINK